MFVLEARVYIAAPSVRASKRFLPRLRCPTNPFSKLHFVCAGRVEVAPLLRWPVIHSSIGRNILDCGLRCWLPAGYFIFWRVLNRPADVAVAPQATPNVQMFEFLPCGKQIAPSANATDGHCRSRAESRGPEVILQSAHGLWDIKPTERGH